MSGNKKKLLTAPRKKSSALVDQKEREPKRTLIDVDSDGSILWRKELNNIYNLGGVLHRDGDKPAVISFDGRLEWWKYGKRHRDGDEPALIQSDGTLEYYKKGKIHRDDGKPAVIYPSGSVEYWANDQVSLTKTYRVLRTVCSEEAI